VHSRIAKIKTLRDLDEVDPYCSWCSKHKTQHRSGVCRECRTRECRGCKTVFTWSERDSLICRACAEVKYAPTVEHSPVVEIKDPKVEPLFGDHSTGFMNEHLTRYPRKKRSA
jgi:hypothetical protein